MQPLRDVIYWAQDIHDAQELTTLINAYGEVTVSLNDLSWVVTLNTTKLGKLRPVGTQKIYAACWCQAHKAPPLVGTKVAWECRCSLQWNGSYMQWKRSVWRRSELQLTVRRDASATLPTPFHSPRHHSKLFENSQRPDAKLKTTSGFWAVPTQRWTQRSILSKHRCAKHAPVLGFFLDFTWISSLQQRKTHIVCSRPSKICLDLIEDCCFRNLINQVARVRFNRYSQCFCSKYLIVQPNSPQRIPLKAFQLWTNPLEIACLPLTLHRSLPLPLQSFLLLHLVSTTHRNENHRKLIRPSAFRPNSDLWKWISFSERKSFFGWKACKIQAFLGIAQIFQRSSPWRIWLKDLGNCKECLIFTFFSATERRLRCRETNSFL